MLVRGYKFLKCTRLMNKSQLSFQGHPYQKLELPGKVIFICSKGVTLFQPCRISSHQNEQGMARNCVLEPAKHSLTVTVDIVIIKQPVERNSADSEQRRHRVYIHRSQQAIDCLHHAIATKRTLAHHRLKPPQLLVFFPEDLIR